jgi:hypothetical protein
MASQSSALKNGLSPLKNSSSPKMSLPMKAVKNPQKTLLVYNQLPCLSFVSSKENARLPELFPPRSTAHVSKIFS